MAQRHPGAKGRLWEDRFKSVIVESGVAARTMAAYIDLNPVRAGNVTDPASYLRMTIGIAGDKNATKPEHELAPQALNGWPLFGKKDNVGDVPLPGSGDYNPIELGIDLTPAAQWKFGCASASFHAIYPHA